ncbi:MAG: hypothetical protein Q7R66_03455 [Undibacterium sp.]|uniref:hypothetical protein n=1 Tax=Undibacterium sp. TaxID=1914977 RepID=UPI0027180E81|nr:hypothetical protein [Undibacterium sp.]MDO8651228.1 hypothetical protein [Undibacterium sp.]
MGDASLLGHDEVSRNDDRGGREVLVLQMMKIAIKKTERSFYYLDLTEACQSRFTFICRSITTFGFVCLGSADAKLINLHMRSDVMKIRENSLKKMNEQHPMAENRFNSCYF